MPEGMYLRSYWWATSLSHPHRTYNMQHYFREHDQHGFDPLSIGTFLDYALWFQKRAVPDVDETYVANIARKDGQYLITLMDGRSVQSRVVVMAPGLRYYAYSPPEYAHLPSTLVSHTSDYHNYGAFAGKQVVVRVGPGSPGNGSAAARERCRGSSYQQAPRSLDCRFFDNATIAPRAHQTPPGGGSPGLV